VPYRISVDGCLPVPAGVKISMSIDVPPLTNRSSAGVAELVAIGRFLLYMKTPDPFDR
jgi:hypothetical protein